MTYKKPRCICVVSKYLTPDILGVAHQIERHFSRGKCKVCYEKSLGRRLSIRNLFNLEKPASNCDLIITIGGDGTLLRTVYALKGKKVPVVGIRKGAMGFLAEIEADGQLNHYLNRLENGDFNVEERTKLEVKLNGKKVGEVLNDAVVTTALPGKIQKFSIEIHGDKIDEIAADGIIVSTPTGSTAYALSAGGSIIDPLLDAYEIAPISPFRLSARPIVVPPWAKTTIRIITERRGFLVLDGYKTFAVSKKDRVEITKSKSKAYLVKFERNFYLRVKKMLI